HRPRFLRLRVDRDDLAAVKAFDLRLKPLRIDASRGPHVFRLEAPRFAGRQVAKDHERLDRRHLGEDALVSHDVSDVERTEADEGRHPVHLAALLLAEQLRGRGNAPSERLRDLAGERLAEGVRAQIEVEASMDVLDARDEGPRISGAVHAREDKGPYPADFLRREFAAVPAHLEDPFEIPAPLLLTRIAQGRFDSHAHPEVLDRLEGLESPERLDGQREVVRVLFTGDMREGHAFPRRELPDVLTQEPCERWPMRPIRHRDAVALAVLSASLLLAGELANQDIQSVYQKYIVPSGALNNPGFLILIVTLVILGFTTYFGGVFVLLGGLHFSWGRVSRGRSLVGLGIGVSLIGLLGRLAQAVLVTGTLLAAIVPYTTSLTRLRIL